MNRAVLLAAATAFGVAACGEDNTPSYTEAPGAAAAPKTRVLEAGAKLLQDRQPLDAMSAYLDGFHFYNGDPDGQMEAHHYFSVLNEDVMQAVIFDGNTKDAKIMGVEYVISERLFKQLPAEEKALWHSHAYEVKSGALTAPAIPAPADRDRRLEVDTEQIKQRRADIQAPPVDPGANAWEKGNVVQLQRAQGPGEHGRHAQPPRPAGESELGQ